MSVSHAQLPRLWTELLILQPTPFCNIDCSYCYLPARNDRTRMSEPILEAVFGKVLSSRLATGVLTVVWHAGEPLVLPTSWYERAFGIAERHRPSDLTVQHSFQSNGMLVDEGWVEFLRCTGARISLSLDGPAWLHDNNRRTRAGVGTYEKAMRGLCLLQQGGIVPPVITVLTAASLAHPDALFDFYRSAGIVDVAFNVEEVEGANRKSSLAQPGQESAFRRFLDRFIARMQADPKALALREFRYATDVVARGSLPDGANQEAEPMRIISVATNGALSTFSPELLGMQDARYADFLFGNIVEDDIETITARVLVSRLARDVAAGLANCRRTCAWYPLCGGGSPSNKLFERGDPRATETLFCRLTRQTVLEASMAAFERGAVQQGPAP